MVMNMEEKTKLTMTYYAVLAVGLIMSGLIAGLVPTLGVKAMSAFLGILGLLGVKFFANDLPNAILEHRILKKTLDEKPQESIPTNATVKSITIEQTPSLKEAIGGFVKALAPKEEVEEKKDDFPLSSQ